MNIKPGQYPLPHPLSSAIYPPVVAPHLFFIFKNYYFFPDSKKIKMKNYYFLLDSSMKKVYPSDPATQNGLKQITKMAKLTELFQDLESQGVIIRKSSGSLEFQRKAMENVTIDGENIVLQKVFDRSTNAVVGHRLVDMTSQKHINIRRGFYSPDKESYTLGIFKAVVDYTPEGSSTKALEKDKLYLYAY